MERIPPQQQLFNAIFSICLELGYDTFDHLPPEHQTLPFVHIGEQFSQDRMTKRFLFGDVQQTINIYHNVKGRPELTSMVLELKQELHKLNKTNDFEWNVRSLSDQIIDDTTGSTPLKRAIIEVDYTFN